MKSRFVAALIMLVASACSSAPKPKPLPGGPPPEYEAPRSFDLPGAQPAPAEAQEPQ